MGDTLFLRTLAEKYNTDKSGHGYLEHYERVLGSQREKIRTVLEIGVMAGGSLRMWRDYFPQATIYGVDIDGATMFEEERIKTFCGSQDDAGFIVHVSNETGPLDLIVDDGSHRGAHHVISWKLLWPVLKDGGWYAVEDCQSIYNECWTKPWDPNMMAELLPRWPAILTGRDAIREVQLIGNWIYSGLILMRKEAIRPEVPVIAPAEEPAVSPEESITKEPDDAPEDAGEAAHGT